MPKRGRLMKPLSSNKNKLVKLPNYDGNVHKLDKKDLIILNEMLANPDVTSLDISKIINKGDNISPGPRVIESSLRIGDPAVNVVARVIYKSSDELFHIIQEIKKMPNIARVEWSEIVKVVGRNNALVLTDSILRYS